MLRALVNTSLDASSFSLSQAARERIARYMPSDETRATLREVVLMRHDLQPVVPDHRPGDDVVVLVHGFFASAGVWRPLKRRLEEEGARVATFSHAPGTTVKLIAKQLARLVDRIHTNARVHVVGHSLGGVVARWYVQEGGGHERVAQTISLSSPFGGAPVARKFPILVGNDLAPHSHVLTRLRARAHVHDVPHLSITSPADRTVPWHAATHQRHDVVTVDGIGHNSMLYDDEVVDIVVDRVFGPP
jgi:triacylglycerol lipase